MRKPPVNFKETYHTFFGSDSIKSEKGIRGVIEFIIKDRRGNIIERKQENLIKIFAKELLAHRIPSSEIWNPVGGTGSGAWADSNIDPTEEFSARYILFGASFDHNGVPIDNDPRYYVKDSVTGVYVPIALGPGAEYEGGLVNGIPLAEPYRPLKRVESITFQPTYQPAGTPLLQSDVRAINNIVKLETTLRLDEYNGLGVTDSDYFTITEVALVGGAKFDSIGVCECTPRELFLQGPISAGTSGSAGTTLGRPLKCIANSSDTISIDPSEVDVDLIKEGDQVKIVGQTDDVRTESIDQVTPFYLVIAKNVGGRDIQLDRVPVNRSSVPLSGNIGIYRDTLRIFSHRLLSAPIKKSKQYEIIVRWSLIFS
jgi:hypothetical protein